MRRIATLGRRAAALAALAAAPILWACESQPTEPMVERPRIFRATMADGQLLPAQRECPAPSEGMVTGTRFVEGELILYPARTFTWRYTVKQYASVGGSQQQWEAPAMVQGTYAVRADTLHLLAGDAVTRRGRIDVDVIELPESVPCHFPAGGDPHPVVDLDLTLTGVSG